MRLKDSFYKAATGSQHRERGTRNEERGARCDSERENRSALRGVRFGYDIRLDASHFIYAAHFPGAPITPGVCVIQIARELIEEELKQKLMIRRVKNVKFLKVISPVEMPDVTYWFEVRESRIEGEKAATGSQHRGRGASSRFVNDQRSSCEVRVEVFCGEQLMVKLSMECLEV